ncbi:MAG TPA: hypothetical protein VGF14_02940 [Alphaproteobacteria bacterium]
MLNVKDQVVRDYLSDSLWLTGGIAVLSGLYNYVSKDYTLIQSMALHAPEAVLMGFSAPYAIEKFKDSEAGPEVGLVLAFSGSLILGRQASERMVYDFQGHNLHESLKRSEKEQEETPPHRIHFYEAQKQVSKSPAP